MKNNVWFITREQIDQQKVEDAIAPVNLEHLSDEKIFALQGTMRLRIEGVEDPADLFAQAGPRKFFQILHRRWPLTAYFLKVNPVAQSSPHEQIVDLSLFMALALCHVDLTYVKTPHHVGLRCNRQQFSDHLHDLFSHAAELAELVDHPKSAIAKREFLISSAIQSYFTLSEALHPKANKKPK